MRKNISFKTFCDIHYANYAGDAKADELFNNVGNQVGAVAWADVRAASAFDDYCYRLSQLDSIALHLKIWEELTAKEQATYRREYIEDMVYNTGASKSAATLQFDVYFDCCVYNESVYSRREIKEQKND